MASQSNAWAFASRRIRGNYMYYPQSNQRAKANPPAGQELWSLVAKKTPAGKHQGTEDDEEN